jgi:hypothetical protein
MLIRTRWARAIIIQQSRLNRWSGRGRSRYETDVKSELINRPILCENIHWIFRIVWLVISGAESFGFDYLATRITSQNNGIWFELYNRSPSSKKIIVITVEYVYSMTTEQPLVYSVVQEEGYAKRREYISQTTGVKRGQLSHRWLQPPAHAGVSLADLSPLKMEVICSSETSVHTRSTRRHIHGIYYFIIIGGVGLSP